MNINYESFRELVERHDRPVLLIEGTRSLPEADRPKLVALGTALARAFPRARFRTGNAEGADEAFAEGVARVDAGRIEYVLPYGRHRQEKMADISYRIALTEIPRVAEERAAYETGRSSPKYSVMLAKRHVVPQLRAKSRYLLRDTLKVIGAAESGLPPATVGVFYANPMNPMQGGTGHTIRVCQQQGVPVVLQNEWFTWPAGA